MAVKKRKAVALLSGGLDSTLAVKLILEQGIEVHALNFTSAFCTCNSGSKHKKEGAHQGGGCKSEARRVAEKFGIPIKVMVKGLDYIDIVRNPKYGYGKGINPCVDCRIYMFKLAKQYMEEIGADFVITGEVLGQRPMSQRRDTFKIIERESGLEGRILRPLCAKHLEPTIPEKEGIVDRNKLLDMVGRTRKPQMHLAEEFSLDDYPCPSGGCLLTDKIFAKKVRDLFEHKEEITLKDLQLLKVGRHFRYGSAKLVISRNQSENQRLKGLIKPEDTVVEPVGFPGPVGVVCGGGENGSIEVCARLILRYAKKRDGGNTLKVVSHEGERLITVDEPATEDMVKELRVCN
ncbi:MAG TPA: hypothetical protein ENK42_02070 [Deltaproteobacteria bacterium]|nr:hypothetical protein [Deltaproteobacteria bacterium]